MLHRALEAFRAGYAGHPLLPILSFAAAIYAAQRSCGISTRAMVRFAQRYGTAVGLAGIAGYVALAFWYVANPHFFDNAEPTMPAIGWLFHMGQPIYPSIDSAERYAHIYGPLAFMAQGFFLSTFGASIV